ncbi:MAG: ABC transporter substrate-binding protein, partial [Rhodanobacteraceae bacterium]
MHLKNKFAPFVDTFFADSDSPYSIAPAHALSQFPNINQIPFNADPTVTDGPFKFVRWVHGDHIQLASNPGFFMGAPALKEIYVRIIPDENTTVNLVKTHDIDWMFEASINNYPAVKDIPGTKLQFVDINGYEDVQLNVPRPYLQDPRVRLALAYAIDKQQIVSSLTYGQEHTATEDQPPFIWAYDPNIKPYPHDVQKARALLTAAGWTPGSDGIMVKNGQRLTLVLVSNVSNVTRRKSALEIQNMLKAIGVETEVKTYQGDVLFAPVGEGGILQGGKFDLSLAGWYSGVDPDDSSQLTCAQVAPNGYNYSRYCNPQMEAAQTMALQNYDHPTRKKAYFKIQELLYRDVPEVYLYYERQMHVINSDFKG